MDAHDKGTLAVASVVVAIIMVVFVFPEGAPENGFDLAGRIVIVYGIVAAIVALGINTRDENAPVRAGEVLAGAGLAGFIGAILAVVLATLLGRG